MAMSAFEKANRRAHKALHEYLTGNAVGAHKAWNSIWADGRGFGFGRETDHTQEDAATVATPWGEASHTWEVIPGVTRFLAPTGRGLRVTLVEAMLWLTPEVAAAAERRWAGYLWFPEQEGMRALAALWRVRPEWACWSGEPLGVVARWYGVADAPSA